MSSPATLEVPGFSLRAGVHAAGSEIPWHEHVGATLCLAVRGAFREYSRGRAVTCYPSTLKVTPAGEPHRNRFDLGDTRGLLVEVTSVPLPAGRPFVRVLDERLHCEGGAAVAVALRVYEEFTRPDAVTPLAVEGLLLELLVALARGGQPAGEPRARWLADARELLHAEFRDAPTLRTVAASVGVHPVTLARAFRATYGCTMGDYVRRLRVDFAARALRATDRPISEIALESGFADQSHFSNVFRRQLGIAPGRFRAMARE